MNIKQQVLKMLKANKGNAISGEKIAEKLFCSRNAVWKSIKQLQNDGYKIEAVSNKGYTLIDENGVFSADLVCSFLNSNQKVIVERSVTSTNTLLKQSAENGGETNCVLIAENQSLGKGRRGRSFFSPSSGLYMSFLLRPEFSAKKSLLITTSAAVAVVRALKQICDIDAGIKWVNDIYIGDKKCAGILTEASLDFETGGLNFAILGIGINIAQPKDDFPDDLKSIATALYNVREVSPELKAKIAAGVIDNFYSIYNDLENSDYQTEYKQKSILIGRKINVIHPSSTQKAEVLDIDEECRLVVKYDNGEIEKLSSGEVSTKL